MMHIACCSSGPDHVSTLFSVNALAACLSHQKRHTVGIPMLQSVKHAGDGGFHIAICNNQPLLPVMHRKQNRCTKNPWMASACAAWSRSPKFPPFLAQLGILHVPAKQECRCRATVQVKRLHAYASLQRHSVLMNVWSLLGYCTSNCAGQQSPIPVQFPLSNSSFAGLPWKHGKKSSHPTTPSFSQAWMGWACAWWTWATQRPWTSFQWLLLAGRARIFHCFKIIQTTSSSNCCVTCNYCRS